MSVSALVLNYKQRAYVPHCLDALMRQTYPDIETFFVDNASADGAIEYVRANYPGVEIIANSRNLYFAEAHNAAIKQSTGKYVMPLNVDVVLADDFVQEMVRAIELDGRIGMVSGKLLRMDENLRPMHPPTIDSTGLWFTPQLRHFDRGSEEWDRGQYDDTEYIMGPSGAAPLYRRSMLEDIAFQGEYFDRDFVIYREDADLAWRAQLLGWRGLYAPAAVAFHLRRVRSTHARKDVLPEINMHSVRNRFLMRIKNQLWRNALQCLLPMLWRDLQVVGYVVLIEHKSLSAFVDILRLFPRMIEKRRQIMAKKRVDHHYMARWFSNKPVSFPFQVTKDTG